LALNEWYQVRFDERGIDRVAEPPGQAPWSDHLNWDDIFRVCVENDGVFNIENLIYNYPITCREARLV
jgi:hypothetical protein